MPANIQQPLRRRGAVSAEPINEEDAATYVKKVKTTFCDHYTINQYITSVHSFLLGF